MKIISPIILILLTLISRNTAAQIVHYEKGKQNIYGVSIFQSVENPDYYYYLPSSVKISERKEQGKEVLEFGFSRYINKEPKNSFGIFHALFEFTIQDTLQQKIQIKLREEQPNAILAGQLPINYDSDTRGALVLTSSLFNDNEVTSSTIATASGSFDANSKMAISKKLSNEESNLLQESLESPTSEVSVTISGFYYARVENYGAVIKADIKNIYEHFSKVINQQEGFKREQVREIMDDLFYKDSLITIVFDQSAINDSDVSVYQNILELVSLQLTNTLFDPRTGWLKQIEEEQAVEDGQIPDRMKRGWLGQTFGKSKSQPYITDNQYVLKDIKKIKSFNFHFELNSASLIKVPFSVSGNLGGLYKLLPKEYFPVVDLEASNFNKFKSIDFWMEDNTMKGFQRKVNSLELIVKKEYTKHQDVIKNIPILASEFSNAKFPTNYPYLGYDTSDSIEYFQYKILYNLKNNQTISIPREGWKITNNSLVKVDFPYAIYTIVFDMLDECKKENLRNIRVKIWATIDGKRELQKLKKYDSVHGLTTDRIEIYSDHQESIFHEVIFYHKGERPISTGETELSEIYEFKGGNKSYNIIDLNCSN